MTNQLYYTESKPEMGKLSKVSPLKFTGKSFQFLLL